MAHERTELTLGPGVTALTGPNNTGKSAVVEGLRCVATNPMPRNYIRHGAKEARVTVELEDGTRVVWIRKKASAGYELWAPGAEEAQEYWKFGRKPPEDVLAALRLDVIEMEGNKDDIDVHIGNQRDPIFLLNRPDSDAALFFAASSESAHLLAMQNLLKRRTQDANRRERELDGRLKAVETELDELSLLPDIAVGLESVRELEATAKVLQTTIPALETQLSRLAGTEAALDRCQATATVYKGLCEPPKTNDIKPLNELIQRMGRIGETLDRARKIGEALAPVSAPSAPFDTVRLATLYNRLQHLDDARHKADARDAVLVGLQPMPTPGNTDHLAELKELLNKTTAHLTEVKQTWDVLRSIGEPPEVRADSRLEALVADIRGLTAGRQQSESHLNALEKQLRSVRESISVTVDALGHCPTCGADLNSEAFLDQEDGHVA